MTIIKSIILGNKEVLPIIEGGKGIGVSNGTTAGHFALSGAVGTFSGVNAKKINANGDYIPLVHKAKTRKERHEELVNYSIEGGISQAKIARDIAGKNGSIHINILWEMAASQRILDGIMKKTQGLINGITCGAGMPYKLSEIASKYNVYYYPIISSARAFSALWRRSYHSNRDLLGGVVYEDPWLAGGHNGISNADDPNNPINPEQKLLEIRQCMNSFGLQNVPLIMAGGVWWLSEWENIINNKNIAPIAFQFGTRPLITAESPVPKSWKNKILNIKKGDVVINRFSPTGFYSSAIKNNFLQELIDKNSRQISFVKAQDEKFNTEIKITGSRNSLYVVKEDLEKIEKFKKDGFTETLKTPDSTILFVTPKQKKQITEDQATCIGCLSFCKFSNWQDTNPYTTHIKPDPRSFCIQKTLQNIINEGCAENELAFAGHNIYRFSEDPFYSNNFIPTIKQLVERISTGQ